MDNHNYYLKLAKEGKTRIPFFLLPYYRGHSLKDVITDGKKFSEREVRDLAVAVLEAVAYAHSRSVINRDIKPQNILLGNDLREIVLTDFGVAKFLLRGEDITSLKNHEEMFFGTPTYIDPEYAAGENGKFLASPSTDIFSIGATLFEVMTGEKLKTKRSGVLSKHPNVIYQLDYARAKSLLLATGYSPLLQFVIYKCILPKAQRYQHAEEVIQDIHDEKMPVFSNVFLFKETPQYQRLTLHDGFFVTDAAKQDVEARAMLENGIRYLREQDYDNALGLLEPFTTKHPTEPYARKAVADAYYAKGRYGMAFNHLAVLASAPYEAWFMGINRGEVEKQLVSAYGKYLDLLDEKFKTDKITKEQFAQTLDVHKGIIAGITGISLQEQLKQRMHISNQQISGTGPVSTSLRYG